EGAHLVGAAGPGGCAVDAVIRRRVRGEGAEGHSVPSLRRSALRHLSGGAQFAGDHVHGEGSRVALAGQQGVQAAGEPAAMRAVPFAAEPFAVAVPDAGADQLTAALLLVRVAAAERRVDPLSVDLLRLELPAQRLVAERPQVPALLDPVACEGLVVDQAGPVDAGHHLVGDGAGHLPLPEPLAHLPGRAAAGGEQAHQVPALVDDGLLPLGALGIRGGPRAFEDLSGAVGEALANLAGRGTARDGSVVLGGAG